MRTKCCFCEDPVEIEGFKVCSMCAFLETVMADEFERWKSAEEQRKADLAEAQHAMAAAEMKRMSGAARRTRITAIFLAILAAMLVCGVVEELCR